MICDMLTLVGCFFAAELYNFTNITFGACMNGQRTVANGPPDAQTCQPFYAQYGSWTQNTSFFNVSNGIQSWVVPETALYKYASGVTLSVLIVAGVARSSVL